MRLQLPCRSFIVGKSPYIVESVIRDSSVDVELLAFKREFDATREIHDLSVSNLMSDAVFVWTRRDPLTIRFAATITTYDETHAVKTRGITFKFTRRRLIVPFDKTFWRSGATPCYAAA